MPGIDLEAVVRLLLLRTYEEYHGTKQWHCISLNSAIMITFQEYIKAQYPLFPVKSFMTCPKFLIQTLLSLSRDPR